MISYGHGTTGFILTVMLVVFALITCFISIVIIILIIYYQYHRRLKREEKITLLLFLYIYSFIFIATVLQFSMNIETLIGDIYGNDFYSPWCIPRAYLILVSGSSMYFTFVVQAIFRLCRIVYSNYGWLQSYRMFMLCGPVLFIGANILISPVLVWHDIFYLPKEHCCYIMFARVRSTVWIMIFCYLTPIVCLLLIHINITIFLRRQPTNIAISIKRRQQRDLMIVQRIFHTFGILLIFGLPAMIIFLISIITGVTISLHQRITLLTMVASLAVLSVAMIVMTPQLKKLVIRQW